jgi:4-hydroxy-2-oxoglutarate aldolase
MKLETLLSTLPGAYPALITPMTALGDIDHVSIAANIRRLSTLGLAGVLALGSTGEQPNLSEFERALVLEVTRRNLPDSMILLAGTGLAGTRLTIEETKRAAEAGADAALVVTPSYYQKAMNAPNLIAHYTAVADASPIPILLYSVPGIIGVTLPPQAVGELAKHPNIIGMKNSSSDLTLAVQYRLAAGRDFIMLAGSAHATPASLWAGVADGTILAVATVCPEAAVEICAAVKAGDTARAHASAAILYAVAEEVGKYGIAGWKAGAEARGYGGGVVRQPLRNLTDAERDSVTAWVQATLGE